MSTGEDEIQLIEPFNLTDEANTVEIRKVQSRNGERLQISRLDDGSRIRIDPIGLESLSWQHPDELAERLHASDIGPVADPSDRVGGCARSLTLLNEFAEVIARPTPSEGTEYLDVIAPKVGHAIRLSPSILAALTHRDMDLFSEFLETPYGPDDH